MGWVPGPKWSQDPGPLWLPRPQLSVLQPRCLCWKENGYDVFPKNAEMALVGPPLRGHASRCCRLWGRRSSSLHGEETGRATVPRDAPEAQKEAPGFLPSPGLLILGPLPPPPPACILETPARRREQTEPATSARGPVTGTLTAGVLGAAVRLFKVVLCFALYSPTESAFCW